MVFISYDRTHLKHRGEGLVDLTTQHSEDAASAKLIGSFMNHDVFLVTQIGVLKEIRIHRERGKINHLADPRRKRPTLIHV